MLPIWLTFLPLRNIRQATCDLRISPDLIAAIISVESNGDECATRYEEKYRYLYRVSDFSSFLNISEATETVQQKTSWGLMQIMGAVARELGHSGHLVELCNPKLNLKYGVKKLTNLAARYSDMRDIISAYNAGSPKKKEDGTYINQGYVDKVIEKYNELMELRRVQNEKT